MANLETLLEFKPLGKAKKSGKTVMGVYADEEVLDKLRDLCLGNCHSFAPCTYIGEAEHFLKNSGKGFYDPIAVEISLAEQNGYEFIRLLKAEFRTVMVYVTYAADSKDSMKTRLEEIQKHMWDNALLVQWPKTQAGSSSEAADLSVLKNAEYNDPEDAIVSSDLQLGLPEDDDVSTNLQLGFSAKRKRDTNDPEE